MPLNLNLDQVCSAYASNLKQGTEDDFRALVSLIAADPDISDIRFAAYMLATVGWECKDKANHWQQVWRPIEEAGRGKGVPVKSQATGKPYGESVTFQIVNDELKILSGPDDPNAVADSPIYTQTYYGRGLVQLTHLENYQRIGHQLGLGWLLVTNPEKALELPTAYAIMSHGMRNASFTKYRLADFVHDIGDGVTNFDYLNARRIINGVDQAATIAGYAKRFAPASPAGP